MLIKHALEYTVTDLLIRRDWKNLIPYIQQLTAQNVAK